MKPGNFLPPKISTSQKLVSIPKLKYLNYLNEENEYEHTFSSFEEFYDMIHKDDIEPRPEQFPRHIFCEVDKALKDYEQIRHDQNIKHNHPYTHKDFMSYISYLMSQSFSNQYMSSLERIKALEHEILDTRLELKQLKDKTWLFD